jgi:mono/diheme cytochrome c family protein
MLLPWRLTLTVILGVAAIAMAAEVPTLYTAQCANCHGADGRGKTAGAAKMEMPDLHSKKVQGLSDSDLYESIARGSKHRAYPHAYLYRGMKEKEIRELVIYIRSFAPATK